jgi:hypothetical protein
MAVNIFLAPSAARRHIHTASCTTHQYLHARIHGRLFSKFRSSNALGQENSIGSTRRAGTGIWGTVLEPGALRSGVAPPVATTVPQINHSAIEPRRGSSVSVPCAVQWL